MTMLTWLGHATWLLKTAQYTILVDPFLDDSPTAPVKADDVEVDFILVSHGHEDHISDCVKIARRTGALVISNYEICTWLAGKKVKNTMGHNLGGASNQPFGRVKLTLAHHSSLLPDGTGGGNPSGFLLTLTSGEKIYFACDTGLFYDMKLIGSAGIDLAVLPIGDLFTMGPDDALEAVKLIEPKHVVPSHYNTWPPIAQDAEAWCRRVRAETNAAASVLKAGESLTL